jgi:hypothetical protein
LLILLILAVTAIGCGRGGDTPAASATGTGGANASAVEEGGILEFSAVPITVERGKSTTVVVTANRKSSGKNKMYQGEIKLEFDTSTVPGLTIEPGVIPAGQEKSEVTVKATADAKPAVYDRFNGIKVIGSGKGIEPQDILLTVTIR